MYCLRKDVSFDMSKAVMVLVTGMGSQIHIPKKDFQKYFDAKNIEWFYLILKPIES